MCFRGTLSGHIRLCASFISTGRIMLLFFLIQCLGSSKQEQFTADQTGNNARVVMDDHHRGDRLSVSSVSRSKSRLIARFQTMLLAD